MDTVQSPLQQPPDRLRPRRPFDYAQENLRLRLASDPGVELGVQLGGDAHAGEWRDAGAGAARRSFRFFGYCPSTAVAPGPQISGSLQLPPAAPSRQPVRFRVAVLSDELSAGFGSRSAV